MTDGTYTPNLALFKPTVASHDWGASVNNNFDILDKYGLVGSWFYTVAQTVPNMTVYVYPGVAYVTGSAAPVIFGGGNSPAFTLPTGTGCRLDLLCMDAHGMLSIVQGYESIYCCTGTSAMRPIYPTDKVPLAEVCIRPSGTAIYDDDQGGGHYIFQDVRPFVTWWPQWVNGAYSFNKQMVTGTGVDAGFHFRGVRKPCYPGMISFETKYPALTGTTIIDVNLNDVSILTAPISMGQGVSLVYATNIVPGTVIQPLDKLTFDIDQAGTYQIGAAGGDAWLTIEIMVKQQTGV